MKEDKIAKRIFIGERNYFYYEEKGDDEKRIIINPEDIIIFGATVQFIYRRAEDKFPSDKPYLDPGRNVMQFALQIADNGGADYFSLEENASLATLIGALADSKEIGFSIQLYLDRRNKDAPR